MDRVFEHKSSGVCRSFEDPARDVNNDRAHGPKGHVCTADFQVCRIASRTYGTNLRNVRIIPVTCLFARPAGWEAGDTAGLETCGTLAGAGRGRVETVTALPPTSLSAIACPPFDSIMA